MSRRILSLAAWLVAAATSTASFGAVSMSFDAATPATGPDDQYNHLDDAMVPGGMAPGGGTYNSQSYSDNGGPLGQTFTTPGAGPGYVVNAISVKSVGDAGGGVFDAPNTFSLRISSVSGTNLTPVTTSLLVPTLAGNPTTAVGWLTFSLSGADAAALAPGAQYAFEIFSSNGWFGVDATQGGRAYAAEPPSTALGPSARSPIRRSATSPTTVTTGRSTSLCGPCPSRRRDCSRQAAWQGCWLRDGGASRN